MPAASAARSSLLKGHAVEPAVASEAAPSVVATPAIGVNTEASLSGAVGTTFHGWASGSIRHASSSVRQ